MSVAQWSNNILDTNVDPSLKGRACATCGQAHPADEPHVYNYGADVDEDLTCHICLQPLVSPVDTRCGHTFCRACITSYLRIQRLCPVDRQPLSANDCHPASLMVRRLLDKLEVECPNVDACTVRLPRSELEPHLKHRCPGTLYPCPNYKSGFGCPFKGNQHQLQRHGVQCQYGAGDQQRRSVGESVVTCVDVPAPAAIPEGHISHIEIPRKSSNQLLGMSIVGGYDSPLRCIIIQEIHPGGAVVEHGRLQPGDQLLEVNGKDLTHCPHGYVVNLLRGNLPTVQLSVYREQVDPPTSFGDNKPLRTTEILTIQLNKHPHQSFGFKIKSNGKRAGDGIFIAEVIEGSIAAQNGRLRQDDQILEMNSEDMRRSSVARANFIIDSGLTRLELLVSRERDVVLGSPLRSSPPPRTLGASFNSPICLPCVEQEAPPLPPRNTPPPLNVVSQTSSCDGMAIALPDGVTCPRSAIRSGSVERQVQPRYVSIAKNPTESLGIRVAGGLESQQGNTPVYIQNIAPLGCLGRSKLLKKGDVLLSVNLTSLLGVSHSDAVAALKVATNSTSLTLGVVDGAETSRGLEPFTPSWMYWHRLPRSLHLTRTVILRRQISCESLGFSLVGGKDDIHGENSFHVLHVLKDSIAAKEGKLRCGDQILSVNGHRLDGLKHFEAVNLLKHTRSKTYLDILSWPGTIV